MLTEEGPEPNGPSSVAITGVAFVAAVDPGGALRVRLQTGALVDARLGVLGYEARPGDEVLVTFTDAGGAWVIGVGERVEETPMLDAALETAHPRTVRDRNDHLLFEYDPETHTSVLHVPLGDLVIQAPGGAVRFEARDGLQLSTDGSVEIVGRAVKLSAGHGTGPSSSVRLQPAEISLVSAVVSVAADRAELLARQARLKASTVESNVQRAKHVARVIEVRAGRIVERARDVYREASGLSQIRAGRLRLVAAKAAQLVGQNTLVKARDRMKIKGERIHLA